MFLDLFAGVTPEHAASLGLFATDELVVERSRPVLYSQPGELLALFGSSLAPAARSPPGDRITSHGKKALRGP